MSVKSFKFVSPGVFINEIDNSFIPKSADAIGPVVVGRSTRGLALQPTKVESYSEFVEAFGDTMPGNMGGDVYRDGNGQSPMYGTYAAKAFLNANVGPVTYMRLLGAQHTDATSTGYCGWKTNANGSATHASNGGAYGLWIFATSSATATRGVPAHLNLGIGTLAAVWYVDNSSSVELSGTAVFGNSIVSNTASLGGVVGTDSNGLWTVLITGSGGSSEKFKFNFDDSSQDFIRKVFNTNPQLGNLAATDFYNSAVRKTYWLGETYEQSVRTGYQDTLTGSSTDQTSTTLLGVMQAINLSGTVGTGPQAMTNPTGGEYVEGKAGWFVGQDLGAAASIEYNGLTKLFRLIGRGHGEWLQKNAKASIENIRISTSALSEYGSFSIVLRSLNDTDNMVSVLERFDNLTLNPASPDFVARRIGNMYYEWSDSERRLKQYGEFPNQSKFVYVDANEDVLDGSTEASLLPFGYYGPPRFSSVTNFSGTTGNGTAAASSFLGVGSAASRFGYTAAVTVAPALACALDQLTAHAGELLTGSFHFPRVRLRNSASDGGLSDPRSAYFGMQTTRSPSSTVAQAGIADYHRMLYSGMPDDPSTGGTTGVDGYAYIFTLDDVAYDNVTSTFHYESGSRASAVANENSYTAQSGTSGLLDKGYDKFTAPFFGGFDAVNIYKPDPFYNAGMTEGSSTELNDYIYNTYKRAIDTVSDPEFINMNLLTTPGLTLESLTTHEVRVCEERADAMALIDLPLVYRPPAEAKLTRPNRVATTPDAAATALRNRQIDSSYGCTFYPWVQTRDAPTSQLLWIPPTVAMLGVLASSQAKSDVWFAPAGFNRGGLTDGAAGIPITNVTERLTSKQRDTLYENSINPIASFPSTGIVLFGQKTLQQRQSALDRINVRRLVIYLKKQISILATQVLFDQNVQSTWDKFVALVNPLLANTQIGFGISDYRLILDSSTTTPDLIDQNILYAKIMVKPARAIEYIAIDFVIMSTGASFDD
jgi:hypothetical protein